MILTQLLGRQCRAKIPVPLADDRQNRAPQRLGLAPVTAATASFRGQAGRTFTPIGSTAETLDGARARAAAPPLGRQSSLIQILQHLEPLQHSIAHQPNRHPKHPGIPPWSVICNWRRVTF
jgi:hypothetical protein